MNRVKEIVLIPIWSLNYCFDEFHVTNNYEIFSMAIFCVDKVGVYVQIIQF